MTRVLRRLARTSADEIIARCRAKVHETAEAIEFGTGPRSWNRAALGPRLVRSSAETERAAAAIRCGEWGQAGRALRTHFLTRALRFPIDPARRESLAAAVATRFPNAAGDASARAERVISGRYDLLGYRGLSFRTDGDAIDWHWDPVHRRRAPTRFWTRVPYLDPSIGDHKIIWEINRHQHWLRLGRAAWLTGDPRYAAAIVRELESWMRANPPFAGVNWASMLELALRSISWIWALHFVLPFDEEEPAWVVDLLLGLDRQLDHVARHLSVYFSPNTHLLGEGLALYVAGRVLPELTSAPRWEAIGRRVLVREARAQVHADGGHAELSTHYHRYALDFYLLALAVARQSGDAAAEHFEEVAGRLATFCRAMAGDDGLLPTLGDDDGGQLFPICGRPPAEAGSSLAAAAALLGRPDLAVAGRFEEAFWLTGREHAAPASQSPRAAAAPGAASTLFPDTGYAVLRRGGKHGILDTGRHGFLNGGHAHADALSLVLSAGGRPLLIDPGTATYTMDAARRNHFRSTAMHNTGVVDGRPQSVPAGPFHWRTHADAALQVWRTGEMCDYVEAEHDGYLPLVHRRAVLVTSDGLWFVVDHLLGGGTHDLDVYWHVDPAWTLEGDATDAAYLTCGDGLAAVLASTTRNPGLFHGDPDGLGWCAPVYGQLRPALTVRFRERAETPCSIVTGIAAAAAPLRLTLERHAVRTDRPDGWHRTGVLGQHDDARVAALFATPIDGGAPRGLQRIAWADGELSTDARAAVFRLSPFGDPAALTLVDARFAAWSGPGAFEVARPSAEDLHLDRSALARAAGKLDARCAG